MKNTKSPTMLKNMNIALDTLNILKDGKYILKNRKVIDLSNELNYSINNSKMIEPIDIVDINSTIDLDISVVQKTTVKCLIDLYNKDKNFTILNFASASNPGGNFKSGVNAQEESLARVSGLYYCLKPFKNTFYKLKKNLGQYTNNIIFSPKVPFIKNDFGEVLNEVLLANIITSAAVNARLSLNKKNNYLIMKKRINYILNLILSKEECWNGYVILGAFGCGVFKNDPYYIAKIFKEEINKKSTLFQDKNINIVFAIPDNKNFDIFKNILS